MACPGITWTYLRFVQETPIDQSEAPSSSNIQHSKSNIVWLPAAGTFPDWPTLAALITFLDPCMGSGHFPLFALPTPLSTKLSGN